MFWVLVLLHVSDPVLQLHWTWAVTYAQVTTVSASCCLSRSSRVCVTSPGLCVITSRFIPWEIHPASIPHRTDSVRFRPSITFKKPPLHLETGNDSGNSVKEALTGKRRGASWLQNSRNCFTLSAWCTRMSKMRLLLPFWYRDVFWGRVALASVSLCTVQPVTKSL